MIKSDVIKIQGLDIFYQEAGQGEAVLLVHGWPTNSMLWRHVLKRPDLNRRYIALDLPGYGNSSKPTDRDFTLQFYANIIHEFLKFLSIDSLGMTVHDAGGPIGLAWAIQHPSKISKLMILNTVASNNYTLMEHAAFLAAKTPLLRNLMTSPWGLRTALRMGMNNKSLITDEMYDHYLKPFQDKPSRRSLAKALGDLHHEDMSQILQGLDRFSCPVKLLYGDSDRILPRVAQTMAAIKGKVPHASMKKLLNTGHFLQEDQPDLVADEIINFFA